MAGSLRKWLATGLFSFMSNRHAIHSQTLFLGGYPQRNFLRSSKTTYSIFPSPATIFIRLLNTFTKRFPNFASERMPSAMQEGTA